MPANSTSCTINSPPSQGWKDKGPHVMPKWEIQEDIVISGFSGRYPESNNVEELKKNLFEGIDMITENDRRWKPGIFGTPKRMGKLKEISKFDWLFFGVHGKQADAMDPMHRLLVEATYEAIFDAGFDPSSLKGKSVGVFVGCSDRSVSNEKICHDLLTGYELLGTSQAMLANRISYTFGFSGPSMAVDTACSSTLHAFNEAVLALRNNRCDAAIVGGATISLSANTVISFARLGFLSNEGTCKVFDDTANGYVRSEAVGAMFLQRASDARRCYSTVLHCKINNDGAKPEGISFPSSALQTQLLREVFSELDMNPTDVDYVEAHGTGTVAGDREESNVIANFFCPGRETPLLVGSVKSNLGHAEAASGTCTIAKVLLAMEEGVIPPNLHYRVPNHHVPALVEGRMQVVAKKTPWKPGVVVANNFGFGGSNASLLLRANPIEKSEATNRTVPRLALVSGRNEAGVRHIFDKIVEEKFTDEALYLLEEACKAPTQGMRFRGYALVQKPGEELNPVIESAPTDKRPVWFLFSGMGSQWSGMAKDMMRLEIFSNSIKMSAQVLKPYGVDLIHLLTEASDVELNNIVVPFVTIAAVQIALVEVVNALGIKPEGIVGHSVGELGCAYADGCFTAEQMLLAAYWRGKSCTMAKLTHGAMAAIGMSWEEAKKRCPEDVFPVCHNAEDSVTISGPAEKVQKFVQMLNSENIFAREVKTCDIAFHSKYVEPASHIMRKELSKVIPNPLPRSLRWVSSSVPEEDWEKPHAKLSSVDYHINNLLSPVLFSEAMAKVPKNAIIIEFAPHSLLQAIVKRILGRDSIYIGLMKRQHEDNLVHILSAIGKIFTSNLNPSAKNLYDPVTLPVSRGTAMLNSLIKWDHSTTLFVWNHNKAKETRDMVLYDTARGGPNEYLLGHKIDGRILFPFMGYVYLAWKALAAHFEIGIEEISVTLEDFSVFRATILPKGGSYSLSVKFMDCDGGFRILDGTSIVASGKIYRSNENVLRTLDKDFCVESRKQKEEHDFVLDTGDFYKELRLRGYEYGPTFQGVVSAHATGMTGKIKWADRWVSFMDAMLQIPILCIPLRALLLPVRVKSIRIDPEKKPKRDEEVLMQFNPHTNVCRAGPVEIQGLNCAIAPKRRDHKSDPVLEQQLFVPLFDSCILDDEEMKTVEEYSHVCSTLAHQILVAEEKSKQEVSRFLNGFKEAPEELVKSMLSREGKDHILLRILNEILGFEGAGDLKEKANAAYFKHGSDIQSDFLCTRILNERALRAALDVVQDNQFSPKMKVLEVSADPIIQNNVLRMLNMTTLGLVKYEYQVARISEKPVPEEMLTSGLKTLNVNVKEAPLPSQNDLTVAKDIFIQGKTDDKIMLEAIVASVKPNGFVLLMERTYLSPAERFISTLIGDEKLEKKETHLEEMFRDCGLTLISKRKDQLTSVLYLLRKRDFETENSTKPIVIEVSEKDDFKWVDKLREVIKENTEKSLKRTIWLSSSSSFSGIVGFVNCLKQEPGGQNVRYVYTCPNFGANDVPSFTLNEPFFQEVISNDLAINVLKNNQWGMYRHRLIDTDSQLLPRKKTFLNVTKRGDLSSFAWIENFPVQPYEHPDWVPVEIYYSALNFKDVMLASGKLPLDASQGKAALEECILGLEFVGRGPDGRRLMGIANSKALATSIFVQKELLTDVPDEWTMEQASTVPVVYMTSYYALLIRGNMQPGESVLIHSGTGGVGQAAISIALSMGCKVYTTVGSVEKREFLKNTFPELTDDHIFNSRDVRFEYEVLNATEGKGVDLVLNSLAEDKLQASVRCLRTNGRFLEIGKYDIITNSNLGMSVFLKNITFHAVFLDLLLWENNNKLLTWLQREVLNGIKSGVVRPLKTNVFDWNKGEEAFRFMASGQHIGKVVLKIREEETQKLVLPSPIEVPAVPRMYCQKEKSYVVTGGLGGFGFELASWLVDRGARKVVLSSRSNVKNEYQRLWIERWKNEGAQVLICNDDISTRDGCKALLNQAKSMGPVGGIFHLAMVLHDGLFENLKSDDFKEISLSKADGVLQLDSLSRMLCPSLDYFVVFSSISCGRGNPGQSNYGYANSVMERVVEQRREIGLPGVAIQWGGVGDVGVVYEKMGGNEVILKGTVPQRLNSCLSLLDRFLHEGHAVVSSFVPVEKAAFSSGSREDMISTLCKALGIKDPSSVSPDMTLGELGMDSLIGVEIKQVLETEYDTVLSVPEVRQLSMRDLQQIEKNKKTGFSLASPTIEHGDMSFSTADMYIPKEIMIPLNESQDTQYVFFVHPMEGHVKMLESLAKNIKCKVYGLQFTDQVPSDTIENMAACYVEHIKKVQPHGPYRLLGYSFGTMVAFEMALLLHKTDHVKSLICIDGSPKALAELGNLYVRESEKKNVSFLGESILFFIRLYLNNVPYEVESGLLNAPDEDIKSHFLSILRPFVPDDFDFETATKIGERAIALSLASKAYNPKNSFQGRVTLVKSKDGKKPEKLHYFYLDDYGLKENVDGAVEIFALKGTHHTITSDTSNELSKIINDRI